MVMAASETTSLRALVTGGTSKLGSAIVERLRTEGLHVVAAGSRDGDVCTFVLAKALAPEARVVGVAPCSNPLRSAPRRSFEWRLPSPFVCPPAPQPRRSHS